MRAWVLAGAVAVAGGALAAQETVTVDLVLDPTVEAELQARGEWVVVNAWFYGDPALDSVPMDEMGLVYLGEERATVYPVSQRVVLGGYTAGVPRDWVLEPILNVNVFSARMTDQNNLLNCGIVEGPVAELAGAVQTISCTQIGN
jgi:hypothetical protein